MSDVHARVTELIPWFVNGTLAGAELSLVERHIGECLVCRRAMQEARALRAAIRSLDVPNHQAHGLRTLLDTITSSERPGAARQRKFAPRTHVEWLGLAAAASIAALSVALLWAPDRNDSRDGAVPDDSAGREFRTLADSRPGSSRAIDVIFAAPPDAQQLEDFARGLGAAVIAGPSELGRYTLALPPAADRAQTLAALQNDPHIRFAGPAFPGETAP